MELKDYTTEEIKDELRRRIIENKKARSEARKNAVVCRNCKFYCTINNLGVPIDPTKVKRWDNHCCPYVPNKKNPTRFRCLTDTHSCEHFSRKL